MDKKVGTNQPTRIENAKILIANTPMDADKIKVFGSRVRVDSVAKVAELELAEKVCTLLFTSWCALFLFQRRPNSSDF